MASNAKTTVPSGQTPASPQEKTKLPLHLLRHGSGLIGFGLLFGFLVPHTPYPRLGLTAHIQFAMEGTMVCAAGLILGSRPFTSASTSTSTSTSPDTSSSTSVSASTEGQTVADRLKPWQRNLVYWGCAGIWVTLLSETANAWWGTRWVLQIAHRAAGLAGSSTGPAALWMERVVVVAHYPFACLLATVWPVITVALFSSD